MSDLVITEEDGWFEVSDIVAEALPDAIRELWTYIGQGAHRDAAELLQARDPEGVERRFGMAPIERMRAAIEPDDVLGERLRVWVHLGSVEGEGEGS